MVIQTKTPAIAKANIFANQTKALSRFLSIAGRG
jgi:hypothetical protein